VARRKSDELYIHILIVVFCPLPPENATCSPSGDTLDPFHMRRRGVSVMQSADIDLPRITKKLLEIVP